MRTAGIFTIAVCMLVTGEASAWNLRGHMTVAAAAWDQMTPATRARATALLRLNPDYAKWIKGVPAAQRGKVAFTRAAGWADDIKSKSGYTNDGEDASVPNAARNTGYTDMLQHRYWHYIDMPFSTDGTPLVWPSSPNAETQINVFRDTIGSWAPDNLKSYDLAWLLHLVGDVHQPLHATSRFSHASPKGDRGGNTVALCKSPCRDELHAFWDGALGTGTSPTAAIKSAGKLHPAPASASNTDVHAWIVESFDAAKTSVYKPPVGPGNGPYTLTARYKSNAKAIANDRAATAAARLAKLLNDNLH